MLYTVISNPMLAFFFFFSLFLLKKHIKRICINCCLVCSMQMPQRSHSLRGSVLPPYLVWSSPAYSLYHVHQAILLSLPDPPWSCWSAGIKDVSRLTWLFDLVSGD